MDPPPRPPSSPPTSTSLFQVYLRLRPHGPPTPLSSVPPTPSKSLYPILPTLPERFLAVEPADEQSELLNENDNPMGAAPMPTHITIHPPSRGDSRKRAVEKFAFTSVFEEDKSQSDVYYGVGVPGVVEGVLKDGRDGLVATLGVTGSGKTHTMLGTRNQRGITQLSLDLLFRSIETKIVHAGHSPMLIPSLISADASEAQIYGAGSFLDGIYGDSFASRAATPMTVGTSLSYSAHSKATRPSTAMPASAKHHEGPFRQWEVLGLDRNFTPLEDKPVNTKTRLRDVQDTITVTSTPSRRHAATRPIAPPALPDISDTCVSSTRNMEYAILVSMYEVYNDRIFDLLSYNRGAKDTRRRALLFKSTEGSPDRKVVAGLRKIVCGSYEEAILVLETGLMERRVAGTGSNSVSSRSHGFFCVEVKKRPRGGIASHWSGSHLTIVDLAGSERARNAKTAGATLAEAGKINESLMYLGQCLQMQSDAGDNSKPNIVPFRQCKLTELLFSNSFPTHTAPPTSTTHHSQPQRAVMIVTADPHGDFNATSPILRYSALAREVTVPRIPSVTAIVFQGAGIPASSSKPSSGRTTPEDSSMIQELEADLSRLTDQVDVLALQVAEERVRRREAEANWARAEERMEQLEQSIREEVVADMEARAAADRRRWLDALGEAADRSEAHLDQKLDILQRGTSAVSAPPGLLSTSALQVYEDSTATPGRSALSISAERNAQIEEENRELRARLRRMEHELLNRSPTRGSAVKNSTPAVKNTTPTRGSALRHVVAAEAPPKMDVNVNAKGNVNVDIGMGLLGTARLGLSSAMDDPFASLSACSSPLVSQPGSPALSAKASPRPGTPERKAVKAVKAKQDSASAGTGMPKCVSTGTPDLPDEEGSLFETALDETVGGETTELAKDEEEEEKENDKENTPHTSTLAATQALAMLTVRCDSEESNTDQTAGSPDKVPRKSTGPTEPASPQRVTRSSMAAAAAAAAAAAHGNNALEPQSPTKRSTRSSTRVTRSSHAATNASAPAPAGKPLSLAARQLLANPYADLSLGSRGSSGRGSGSGMGWRDSSLMSAGAGAGSFLGRDSSFGTEAEGESGNWVVYGDDV